MLILMTDPFAQAVESALQRLIRAEGHNISQRELARRAGVNYRTLHYNLSPQRQATGRRIDPKLAQKLAAVLPVSEDELMRAAQAAAGYKLPEPELPPDPGDFVVRFLDNGAVPEADKAALRARLMNILAEEMNREIDGHGNSNAS